MCGRSAGCVVWEYCNALHMTCACAHANNASVFCQDANAVTHHQPVLSHAPTG